MVKTPGIITIINRLKKEYPAAKIALKYSSPFELLIATILSAQCTDERVNIVTEKLFKKYKTLKDFAIANPSELEKDIYSTGFYKNKARNIINCAKIIIEKFNGRVPDTMDELISLPGVARKTANIVLYNAFGKTEGIAVDTHVIRLSRRLGLTKNENPEKIEVDLMKTVPKSDWGNISYLLQFHGRNICQAKKPKCDICVFTMHCPKNGLRRDSN